MSASLCGSIAAGETRKVRHADLSPAVQRALGPAAASERDFEKYIGDVEAETTRRVAEGDREHLIYYALQSERFTKRARIEPALSARRFVDGLPADHRQRLLGDPAFLPPGRLPGDERTRLAALLTTLGKRPHDARLAHFAELLESTGGPSSADGFYSDYVRVARFLYKKEFVAPSDAAEVARLYQSRPHSSDTQIDAGFAVSTGLAVIHALDPAFRVRRVLIVGPGLDLAPRTDLIDAADPQSYQPLAVADALLALSLASDADLRVHSVDVNPRVVRAVQRLGQEPPKWHLFSGITDAPAQKASAEYREYVRRLGRAIGMELKAPAEMASHRHYQHSIAVSPALTNVFSAERLNVITERLTDESVDIIVATNVLPYFDDRQLALALTNFAAMLGPGGYLIHNESRDPLPALASAARLPALQMRTVVLGGHARPPALPAPSERQRVEGSEPRRVEGSYDVVWIHQKPSER